MRWSSAWESKYAHNRRRPGEMDSGLTTAVAAPRSPSYPCEHSVAAGAAAAVIAHIYPKEARGLRLRRRKRRAAASMAGVAFPSDTKAGLELGRAVAARVIEQMKVDGGKWTGTVPTGPGLWKGTNPVGVDEVQWPRFVLTSPSQFRPGPPPAARFACSAPPSWPRSRTSSARRSRTARSATGSSASRDSPGVLFRLSDEVGRRLAEDGLHASAPRAARAYALVHVAHYEGWIASQDAKFHYWTARPNQFDPTLTTVIPTPPFPTYPSNAATLVKAPTVVLSYLFPRETRALRGLGARSSANRAYGPASTSAATSTSGWEIGRQVGEAVVERAKRDGA